MAERIRMIAPRRPRAGFTVAELLVAAAVGLLVLSVAFLFFFGEWRSEERLAADLVFSQERALLALHLERDLRNAGRLAGSGNQYEIESYDFAGEIVVRAGYAVDGAAVVRRQEKEGATTERRFDFARAVDSARGETLVFRIAPRGDRLLLGEIGRRDAQGRESILSVRAFAPNLGYVPATHPSQGPWSLE